MTEVMSRRGSNRTKQVYGSERDSRQYLGVKTKPAEDKAPDMTTVNQKQHDLHQSSKDLRCHLTTSSRITSVASLLLNWLEYDCIAERLINLFLTHFNHFQPLAWSRYPTENHFLFPP